VAELHEYVRDTRAVDIGGMFVRRADGEIEFAKGKHKGRLLSDIASSNPDYLEWMRRSDFLDDTKAIVTAALKQVAVHA
jgi:hypothetical protein